MKIATKVFILLQVLDIALTFFAIRLGLGIEGNPIGFTVIMMLFKFFVIVSVSIVIEKVSFGKLIYLVLAVPFLVVVWNIFIIITSIYLTLK